ncbi:Hypothetical predicted protein [Lecanosticta acicola]|uniref:Uncharacterized protein n=1 Tax=Lecanosticta acicola TaxID=111012 RepID=A0AAI8Z7U5_9PEZI|nr:Hypothetical predicted protein [Lecanosticta acicola]
MGVAGSKVSEGEEQPEPLPLPRCQTTLPGQALAPPLPPLKRPCGLLDSPESAEPRDRKKQKLSSVTKMKRINKVATPVPSVATPDAPASGNRDSIVNDQRDERTLMVSDTLSPGNIEDASHASAGERESASGCQRNRMLPARAPPERRNVGVNGTNGSRLEEVHADEMTAVDFAFLANGEVPEHIVHAGYEATPLADCSDQEPTHIVTARQPTPQSQIDEATGCAIVQDSPISLITRRENRRQIQKAIDILSSSPLSDLCPVGRSARAETPTQARSLPQSSYAYVGFVPGVNWDDERSTSVRKQKISSGIMASPIDPHLQDGNRRRKLGGLWNGWQGMYREDFEGPLSRGCL